MTKTASPADFLLLADGGGTKTRAVLVGPDDRRLAEGLSGPSNLMLGAEAARAAVKSACDRALEAAGTPAAASRLCCAMAGAGHRLLGQQFRAIQPEPAILVTDAYASMVGALGGRPGVGIVVGTGTAAYGLSNDGRVREAGGWGLAIGDEGSGAWIGRAALSLTVKIVDGQQDELVAGASPQDLRAFAQARLAAVGRSRTGLLEWVRKAAPADFASLTPSVVDQASAGNRVAIQLLHRAGNDLQALGLALDPTGDLPVALMGGLAPHLTPYLPQSLIDRVRPPDGDAIDGLLALARGRAPLPDLPDQLDFSIEK